MSEVGLGCHLMVHGLNLRQLSPIMGIQKHITVGKVMGRTIIIHHHPSTEV